MIVLHVARTAVGFGHFVQIKIFNSLALEHTSLLICANKPRSHIERELMSVVGEAVDIGNFDCWSFAEHVRIALTVADLAELNLLASCKNAVVWNGSVCLGV